MTLTTTLSPPISITGGQNIGILPVQPELTVAQAAKILDMSEGAINELLDLGIIESRRENGVRSIQQDSFWEYEADYREGREVMAELTWLAQEMGMYD